MKESSTFPVNKIGFQTNASGEILFQTSNYLSVHFFAAFHGHMFYLVIFFCLGETLLMSKGHEDLHYTRNK